MSLLWPTAAEACWVAVSLGRRPSPRWGKPAAMAPEDTSTTWVPFCRSAARTSTSRSMAATSRPSGVVNEDEPIFTTTRRAACIVSREVTGLACGSSEPRVAGVG